MGGKESIALDLKADAVGTVFERLLESADVLTENFRPGVLEKLGYGWDVLHARFRGSSMPRRRDSAIPARPWRARLRHGHPGHVRHHERDRRSRGRALPRRDFYRRCGLGHFHGRGGQCRAAASRTDRAIEPDRHRDDTIASSPCSKAPVSRYTMAGEIGARLGSHDDGGDHAVRGISNRRRLSRAWPAATTKCSGCCATR